MITVIDYGLGNLTSVYNALKFLGAKAKVSESPDDLKKAKKIVLPGVGSFKDAVAGLKKRGLFEPLRELLKTGKAYLGICLGLQILFELSEEGGAGGLGVLKGEVKRFSREEKVKIPHIGWNRVDHGQYESGRGIMEGIESGSYFYFDHSYYAEPDDKNVVMATTDYGKNFVSAIRSGDIYGVQFHPERSQALGLKLLGNFVQG